MEENNVDHVHVVPVGHDGIENTVRFWIINNPTIVEKIIRPVFHYPYFVFPKAPLIMPGRTVLRWGEPIKVTKAELQNPKKFTQLLGDFRSEILTLKRLAEKLNKMRSLEKLAPVPRTAWEGNAAADDFSWADSLSSGIAKSRILPDKEEEGPTVTGGPFLYFYLRG